MAHAHTVAAINPETFDLECEECGEAITTEDLTDYRTTGLPVPAILKEK